MILFKPSTISKSKNKELSLFDGVSKLFFKYLLALLLVIYCNIIYAQITEVDSLRSALSSSTSESERIASMNKLTSKLIEIDLNEALTYAQKALNLTQQREDKEQEANALNNMGLVLYETAERPSSLTYFEKSERIADELGLLRLQSLNLMSIAKYYRYVDKDSTKTVDSFLKSAEISKAGNHNWCTGRSYAKLASFYTKYNQLNRSEEYLELAAKYYMEMSDGALAMAHYYNEVGEKIWDTNPQKAMDFYLKGMQYSDIPNLKASLAKAYSFIGNHEQALKYIKEAIPYFRKKEKAKRMLGIAIAQLAEVYIELGDYSAANEACDEGIALLKHLGRTDQRAIPTFYRLKGIIAENEGNDKVALEYYTKGFNEATRIKFAFERIKSTLTIGVFHSLRKPKEGKALCRKSLKSARKKNYTYLEIESCNCLYNIYKKEESYVDALYYNEQKIQFIDSLSTLKIKYALDINSKIAEKDKQLAEHTYQKEIKDKELVFQKTFTKSLLIISILGLFLIGFLTLGYRRISKQNKEINEKTNELENVNQRLERSNEELERFAHIASHDLKSPLRNIVSFTGLLRRNLSQKEKLVVNDSLDFIEKNGKRMSQLIEDLLEYSSFSNQEKKEKEIVDLNELVNEISEISPNGKKVIFEISELPKMKWNSSKLFLLFKNIIENGIKYNVSETPKVKVYSSNTSDKYSIYIEDNGIGIEKEYYDEIFVMFQRLHNQDEFEGTGLGLATCKKLVDEFEGEISITSELDKGTIFQIEIPNHLIHVYANRELEVSF